MMPILIGIGAALYEFGFTQAGFLVAIPAAWIAFQMMK